MPNGDTYYGMVKNGKKNGKGTLRVRKSKEVFNGYWKDDYFVNNTELGSMQWEYLHLLFIYILLRSNWMWFDSVGEDVSVGNYVFKLGLTWYWHFDWFWFSWRTKHSCRIGNGFHLLSIGKSLSIRIAIFVELSLQTFKDHDIPLLSLILRFVNEVVIKPRNHLPWGWDESSFVEVSMDLS